MSFEVELVWSADEKCEESYKGHHWGAVKAHDRGWFLQKDGTAWCPKHTPEWVEEWREREAAKQLKAQQKEGGR